jgi:hypothetical protein
MTKDILSSIDRLRSGWNYEREGLLESASKEYRSVLDANDDCVRSIALQRLTQISDIRTRLGLAYRVMVETAELSASLSAPILAALLLWGIFKCIPYLFQRRDIRVLDFPVYGSADDNASAQFRNALLWFTKEVREVYATKYAQSVGMTLLFDDLKGQSIQSSTFDDALAEVKDPGAKAAVRFALTQTLRLLRDWERPRLLIEGEVRLIAGGAAAVGFIYDYKHNERLRLEAHTDELSGVPGGPFIRQLLLSPFAGTSRLPLSRQMQEPRKTSGELYALALILACKIRFEELRQMDAGYKPTSWQTVCLFAAAARTLE